MQKRTSKSIEPLDAFGTWGANNVVEDVQKRRKPLDALSSSTSGTLDRHQNVPRKLVRLTNHRPRRGTNVTDTPDAN